MRKAHDLEYFMDLASEVAVTSDPIKRRAALLGLESRMVKAGMSKDDMAHIVSFYKEAREACHA